MKVKKKRKMTNMKRGMKRKKTKVDTLLDLQEIPEHVRAPKHRLPRFLQNKRLCKIVSISHRKYYSDCSNTYPKNYWTACTKYCGYWKNVGACWKTWNSVLSGTCKSNIPAWHRGRSVYLYCTPQCGVCRKYRIDIFKVLQNLIPLLLVINI